MSKIITYAFNAGDSDLIDTDIDGIIETLRAEVESADEPAEGDEIVFEIKIQKKYTQEEVENLPEWDG